MTWMVAADAARREWKRSRVPMEERRPMLLEALNRLYEEQGRINAQLPTPNSQVGCDVESWALGVGRWELRRGIGRVSLVGAGPGDPELWTVRALRRVEEADLVLYDALVDAESLRRLTRAQCFCVGKRAGRASVKQDTINRLMVRAARQGKRVVRLKGGDPFVFGRGAEECSCWREPGFPSRSCLA